MIPALADAIEGWKFVARRRGLRGDVSTIDVAAALDHARTLATAPIDEPAALFYAFACRPRTFVGGWRFMPLLMAINQARVVGYRLHAATGEVDPLRRRLASAARPPFDQVRAWFAVRLVQDDSSA